VEITAPFDVRSLLPHLFIHFIKFTYNRAWILKFMSHNEHNSGWDSLTQETSCFVTDPADSNWIHVFPVNAINYQIYKIEIIYVSPLSREQIFCRFAERRTKISVRKVSWPILWRIFSCQKKNGEHRLSINIIERFFFMQWNVLRSNDEKFVNSFENGRKFGVKCTCEIMWEFSFLPY
jgi:hypothetical protein